MSHLLRTIAVAQPAFMASSAMRRSCAVTPSFASQTTSATSARSAARWERLRGPARKHPRPGPLDDQDLQGPPRAATVEVGGEGQVGEAVALLGGDDR